MTYNPVLSTLMRSHVPAPSNSVQTQAAPAIKLPIIVLFLPVVIAHPAHNPIPILLEPVLFLASALYP